MTASQTYAATLTYGKGSLLGKGVQYDPSITVGGVYSEAWWADTTKYSVSLNYVHS